MSHEEMLRIATDVGGTFTDLVYLKTSPGRPQEIGTAKSDTTPPDFERGVMNVIRSSGVDTEKVKFFAHGTTLVINALTERKGAKTGLITTAGFRDILEIARGNRPDFFNLDYRKPVPFVPRYLRREVPGRISYKGEELIPLDLSGLPGIVADFKADGVTAVAVCLINAYADPVHELEVERALSLLWPGVAVAVSHRITRQWREYERTSTAVLCAYVKPAACRYLERLSRRLSEVGVPTAPLIMQSNCGVDTLHSAVENPITMVESGPASGVWGAAALGALIGAPDVIALDIGGTTAKCSLITGGQVRMSTDYLMGRSARTAGYPIMVPVVDLVEIGNGGGSIAWVDPFGKLHVGPDSAGAVPGPVAYGRGGSAVTTTDANLALGRINPDFFCGGAMIADMPAVNAALGVLGEKLGVSHRAAARGIVRIADSNMINAVKLVSVNRGHDPRDFTMIAFGGGGGMHACALAAELGIRKVVIPRKSAVFSAWGMLMCDLRRDYYQTRIVALADETASPAIMAAFEALETEAKEAFARASVDDGQIRFQRYGRLRYRNQEHTVEIPLPQGTVTGEGVSQIRETFGAAYERAYTYRLEAPVEVVSFHLSAVAEVEKPLPERIEASGRPVEAVLKGRREVDYAEAGVHEAAIYDGEQLAPGMSFPGPAIVEEAGATVVVPPGMSCRLDVYGNIHISTHDPNQEG